MGLSQAYGFARQSDGAVKVQSKLGWGTTVSLYLPATTAPLSTGAAEQRPPAPGRPARILIVEDESSVAELAAELVREMGHEPVLAHSAEDGLRVLAEGAYDLVFSDIMMPGSMNGLDLAREVRTPLPEHAGAAHHRLQRGRRAEAAGLPADHQALPVPRPVRRDGPAAGGGLNGRYAASEASAPSSGGTPSRPCSRTLR